MPSGIIKILKKIMLLGLILIGINAVIHHYFLPFSWGDENLHTKYTYYTNNSDDFNTVFIGGSLCFRHINPHIVDSITTANGVNISSFNMGGDGIAYLKQARILDEILKDPAPNLEYVFLSLSSTTRFKFINMHTKRFATWQRPRDFIEAVKITWQLPIPLKGKLRFIYFYGVTMIENGLSVGFLSNAIEYLNHPDKYYTEECLGSQRDGFFSYDEQEAHVIPPEHKDYGLYKMLLASKEAYQKEVGRRDTMRLINIYEFENYDPNMVLTTISNGYQKMIEKCAKKNIKLIILMPPRTREPYSWLLPIYDKLPEGNKLNLASPIDFPAFYEAENSYNFHHMNLKGANIFSKDLANEFVNLVKEHPSSTN